MAMQFLEVKPLTSHDDDDEMPITAIAAAVAPIPRALCCNDPSPLLLIRYVSRRIVVMVRVMDSNEWW